MKIIYVGSIYAPQTKEEILFNIKKKMPLLTASDLFQKNIIKGFIENKIQIDVLTVPPVPSYPFNYGKPYISSFFFPIDNNNKAVNIGHCTIPIFKSLTIILNLLRSVLKLVNKSNTGSIVILIYSPSPFFLLSVNLIKALKFRKKISSALIIGDVLVLQKSFSFAKRVQLVYNDFLSKLLYGYTDYFILLSKHLKDKYPKVKLNKTVIVEGVYSPTQLPEKVDKKNRLPTVLYSGSLQEFTGIKNLINAFMTIDNPNLRLTICGSGFYTTYVEEMALLDDRISYRGNIDREEVLTLQQSAKLLVNPRQPNYELTKYSFPSKTMEYFASGTPVLMYKLPGIPDEYYEYCYTLDDLSVSALANRITEIINKSDFELQKMGGKAKEFILANKTSKIQVKRIIEFISIM